MKIGIISDTHVVNPHNCIVPEWVRQAFSGVDMIVHAGDVERPEFLGELATIAPVYAVRGNCDTGSFDVPTTLSVEIGCGLLTVAHRAGTARAALSERSRVLVYGHTHISLINQENSLLVINPGSPTLPRAGLPASVAVLSVCGEEISAELKQRP
ncbi:MAG: metallophosphoesterase [Erysipelotrichia bacterium]|nr:metallophosphoesterase [Erysipelotrichia bacterium]